MSEKKSRLQEAVHGARRLFNPDTDIEIII